MTAGVDKAGIPNVEIQACYVGELAKLANDLGTDMVRIFTAYERPGIPFDKQYAMVAEGLKLAGQKAAKYGVTLAVQNHHDIAAHHDMMYWLLREVNLPYISINHCRTYPRAVKRRRICDSWQISILIIPCGIDFGCP